MISLRQILFMAALAFSSIAQAQLILKVVSTPQLTPLMDTLYVAGNFNNWNPADPAYRMQHTGANMWEITLSVPNGTAIEYKFTRGYDWTTVEGTATGGYIPNRTQTALNGQVVENTIEGWEDLAGNHTVTEHVRILATRFWMPQLNRSRRIWVCLPSDYAQSDLNYPVLYLQDGQNLFDAATSFAGEWHIDETMLERGSSGCPGVIVIGIDNGGTQRMEEYAPWANASYNVTGEGSSYAAFLSNTLKPFIDSYFRTFMDAENNMVGGSSLGALIACYAQVKYPEIFGKAILMSPAFWFNEPDLTNFIAANGNLPSFFGVKFSAGANESQTMVSDVQEVRNALANAGVAYSNLPFEIDPNGQHNEASWSNQFPDNLSFFQPCINEVGDLPSGLFQLYPNPGNNELHLQLNEMGAWVCIRDQMGRVVFQEKLNNRSGVIDTRNLANGLYIVQIQTARTTSTNRWIKN